MSVGEINEKLEGAKYTVAQAPFPVAAEAIGTVITITGVEEVEASIAAVREKIKTNLPGVQGVREAATAAKATVDEVAEHSQSQWLTSASGSLEYMDKKGEQVLAGAEYLDERLEAALGHLAAARTALDEYNEAQGIAVENLGESQAAGVTAVNQITSYQNEISAGASAS